MSTGHIICAATSLQRGQTSLAILEGGSCSTGGCSYSFVYSWWVLVIFFVQLPPSNVARLAWPHWREVATVPEAVVTVLCTPDDGCGWHAKHVDWTCRIMNRLLCVVSRWTIINLANDKIHFLQWPKVYIYIAKSMLICTVRICNKLCFVLIYNDCCSSPIFQVQIYLQQRRASWRWMKVHNNWIRSSLIWNFSQPTFTSLLQTL